MPRNCARSQHVHLNSSSQIRASCFYLHQCVPRRRAKQATVNGEPYQSTPSLCNAILKPRLSVLGQTRLPIVKCQRSAECTPCQRRPFCFTQHRTQARPNLQDAISPHSHAPLRETIRLASFPETFSQMTPVAFPTSCMGWFSKSRWSAATLTRRLGPFLKRTP